MKALHALTGTAPAVYSDGVGWVHQNDLSAMADQAVAHLPQRSLLALNFRSDLPAVVVYLGALRRGHVPLLLDPAMPDHWRQRLLDHFGVAYVFDDGHWHTRVAAPASLHPDLAVLMSTSGSTGSPKLVRLSLAALQANAESIASYLGLTSQDRAITSLPLHYAYGLSVLNSHLVAGASTVLAEVGLTNEAFWQRMKIHGVTGLAGVPTTWRLLRRLRYERMELPELRYVTQAGGRLDPEEVHWLAAGAQAQGRQCFVMYGQTEATARIAYLPPELAAKKPGCIGQAIPGGQLRLCDSEGGVITQPGMDGELQYRGPNVMMGYAHAPQDLAKGPEVVWLNTGDLARCDGDGHYAITGRRSRFIKLFGQRLALEEVEQQLRELSLDAAATGEDDRLLVVVQGTDARDAAALRQRLATLYRVHASAIEVQTIDCLPRSSAGKLMHGELLARWPRRPLQGPARGAAA